MGEVSTSAWHEVSTLDDLWEGDMQAVEAAGKKIVLINVGGDVHAFQDRCPHQNWPLSNGDLEDGTLTCAQHLWTFDVASGKGINPATCALVRYECKVDDAGNISVSVE